MCHEVLHISNAHMHRINGRDDERWNRACDFAINLMLVDNKIDLPEGALLDDKYRDMGAERIYNLLAEEDKNNPQGTTQTGLSIGGFIKPNSLQNPGFPMGTIESGGEIKSILIEVTQALHVARMRGRIPIGMERAASVTARSNFNWREVLANFLQEQIKSDYSMISPNKRYLYNGLYLPSMRDERRGRFIIAFDTSGSIDEKTLNIFLNEVVEIIGMANEPVTLLHCDAQIAKVELLEPGDKAPVVKPAGGGGTDFKPVHQWIVNNDVDAACLIYFTDGQCDSFHKEETIPTLWACDDLSFNPPFGEVIYIDHTE
ncbi:MAG: hypothetical protein IPJ20_19625 [Flammeovirgaceae bacterium]|nr:hypothetical protein [Flammeovirgaceae bacterium]